MKVVELLKIGSEMLKLLSRHGVYLDDWRYVEAFEQYKHMRKLGVKQREAVRMLSEEIRVSRRTLERLQEAEGGVLKVGMACRRNGRRGVLIDGGR